MAPLKPYLPDPDPDKQKRQDCLAQNREDYQFTFSYLSPLALLEDVPQNENFTIKYLAERARSTAELPGNMLAAKALSFFDPFDELQDYEDLFTLLDKPQVVKTFQTDTAFAEQRLSGVNPVVLKRLKPINLPNNLTIEALQEAFGPSLDLADEFEKGNLYLADYTGLASVQGGSYEKGKKHLPKPLAFYCWRSTGYSDRGELAPIAIQLNTAGGGLFTPFDEHEDWFLAKLCVQVADANHHEMSTHLCRTHFVMEPIAIVTARQLAPNHPLGMLLRPHFRFMLANNALGRSQLINRGGPVDRLLAGTLLESLDLVKQAYQSWSFDQFAFPTEIKNRGMDDVNALPHYPYRDDGLLVWQAIKEFVHDYLNIYYKNPADLSKDTELQGWATEMVSAEGGRVKGFPAAFESLDMLIEAVTNIIFTCGPQHSAVNFPQYEYMAFAPNMPLAAYQPIPEKVKLSEIDPQLRQKNSTDEIRRLQFLPPQKRAADQLETLYTLAAYRYDRLGYYEQDFADPDAQNALVKFRQKLAEVEFAIDKNNRTRFVNYPYFKPSLVLNSISI